MEITLVNGNKIGLLRRQEELLRGCDEDFPFLIMGEPIGGEVEEKPLVVEYWDEGAKEWKPLVGMATPTLNPEDRIYWSRGRVTAAEYWAAVLPLE